MIRLNTLTYDIVEPSNVFLVLGKIFVTSDSIFAITGKNRAKAVGSILIVN